MQSEFTNLLKETFTAEAIMTPSAALFTWPANEDGGGPWTDPEAAGFDLVPAIHEEEIVGLWRKGSEAPADLTHGWLISLNTASPDLFHLFAESGRPGYLVLDGQTIAGLVTPADLNKLPVRAYLYNLVGALEMSLARLLRARFRDDWDGLLELLSASSRGNIEAELAQTKAGNVDVDPVEFLHLSDLIGVVGKDTLLRQVLGYPSRSQADDDLGGIVRLRHRIMHPVRPLLENLPDDLRQQQDRVRRARALLHTLHTLGAPQTQPGGVRLFENDDEAYLRWLDEHPGGFLVNTERGRNPDYMVLHRATCPTIGRENEVRPGGFTERHYIKICAESIDALQAWVRQNGRPDGSFSSTRCPKCRPLAKM